MIYIRGDTHGEESQFTIEAMPGESSWTMEDMIMPYIAYMDPCQKNVLVNV